MLIIVSLPYRVVKLPFSLSLESIQILACVSPALLQDVVKL